MKVIEMPRRIEEKQPKHLSTVTIAKGGSTVAGVRVSTLDELYCMMRRENIGNMAFGIGCIDENHGIVLSDKLTRFNGTTIKSLKELEERMGDAGLEIRNNRIRHVESEGKNAGQRLASGLEGIMRGH